MNALQASFPNRPIGRPNRLLAAAEPLAVDFKVESQGRRQNWCWAAVSASVSRYFPHPPGKSMCQVATMELAATMDVDCCASPERCDVTWRLDWPLEHVGHFRGTAGNWVDTNAVAVDLRANNPLPIAVQWRSNGGFHFLAIYGMQDVAGGATMIWVTDPIFGCGSISHYSLVHGGYQTAGGQWKETYGVQA